MRLRRSPIFSIADETGTFVFPFNAYMAVNLPFFSFQVTWL